MNFVTIKDYPYVIHPCGTILRIYKKHTREVKPLKRPDGYMRIGLCKNGKGKMFSIHRLLATAFIPNPENKPCVDHINGIRDDNRLENLRWVTYSENMLGFRTPYPVSIITKGCIFKRGNSWTWIYYISGKQKGKTMKSKEDLEKYRLEKFVEYNI